MLHNGVCLDFLKLIDKQFTNGVSDLMTFKFSIIYGPSGRWKLNVNMKINSYERILTHDPN